MNPEIALKIYNTFKFILPQWTNFRDKYIKLINILENVGNLKDQYDISNKIFLPKDLIQLGLELNRLITNLEFIPTIPLEPLKFMMLYDLKTYLPDDILVKVDRATMAVSLEGREPFLDHKLLEWSSQLPVEFKYSKGVSKYLLRKVLYKYIPKNLIDRPKQGFGVPIYDWFKNDLKELYKEYLNYDRIKQGGIFNPKEVNRLLKAYFENKGVNHNKLWLLFIFELWREKWM
jgi:asparagine synthase (glutamine-hydrolysing)